MSVVSYDYARRNTDKLKAKWDILLLDESHYLKNPNAARTRAVLGAKGIAPGCTRVWALSGTPAPNHVGELWPLLRVFGATRFEYEDFLRRYCHVDPLTNKVYGTKKELRPELKTMVHGKMLRRTRAKVAPELPAATIEPCYIEADPDFYQFVHPARPQKLEREGRTIEAQIYEEIKGLKTDDEILDYLDSNVAELSSLRRLHALLKGPALYKMLTEELDLGLLEKCVVFGYHVDAMKVPHRLMLKDYKTDILYGGTQPIKRDRMLKRFARPASEGGTQVLFASIMAAGTAIDLSAACDGFLLERDWVPANNAQALERMGGYKQTRPIHIRDLIIPNSVDSIISKVLDRKMKDLTSIFGD